MRIPTDLPLALSATRGEQQEVARNVPHKNTLLCIGATTFANTQKAMYWH